MTASSHGDFSGFVDVLLQLSQWFQSLDAFLQVAMVLVAFSLVGHNSLLIVFVALAGYIWAVQQGMASNPLVSTSKSVPQDGDAVTLTSATLEQELKEVDPESRFPYLYSQPQLFHLLHQILFFRTLSSGSFERLLHDVDRYCETAYKLKYIPNSVDPVRGMEDALRLSKTVLNDFQSFVLDTPISTNTGLKRKFMDALEAVRVVLRRDLEVLQKVSSQHVSLNENAYPTVPTVQGPLPAELHDFHQLSGNSHLF